MTRLLTIPHRLRPGMCPVNGIRDLVHWRAGRDWSNEFVWGLGQGGGFAYLRLKAAEPPRQVYTGNAPPRQHRYLAELLTAELKETEARSFRSSWGKAQEALEAGTPPLLGPLDMFHLPYYRDMFHRRHIPIHYVLLVGYDDDKAYVHDTGFQAIQGIPLDDLRLAWDVNVPGMGKRNRFVVMIIPEGLPPTESLIGRSVADACQAMLHPPVSIVGIPAMRKVAREIGSWAKELGGQVADKCLDQVCEYLNSPPDPEGHHPTAGRDLVITYLQEIHDAAGLDTSAAIGRLSESMAVVPTLLEAIRRRNLEAAASYFDRMADAESAAYAELTGIVDASGTGRRGWRRREASSIRT